MAETINFTIDGDLQKGSNILLLGGNPIDVIEYEHSLQKKLCTLLEQIADGLPDMVDPKLCKVCLRILKTDMRIHIKDEEQGLFPLLEKRAKPCDNMCQILSCLAMEHATDESFADELQESLDLLSQKQSVPNPNMTGYMLRCFFECYKRHLIWEDVVVIPLARKLLNHEDLERLSTKMVEHRQTI